MFSWQIVAAAYGRVVLDEAAWVSSIIHGDDRGYFGVNILSRSCSGRTNGQFGSVLFSGQRRRLRAENYIYHEKYILGGAGQTTVTMNQRTNDESELPKSPHVYTPPPHTSRSPETRPQGSSSPMPDGVCLRCAGTSEVQEGHAGNCG